MAKMKAVQVPKAGADFELVEREIPEPGSGHVRIHVHGPRSDLSVLIAVSRHLIGVRLFFRGQLDEICLHSVSELRTL
jgi:hypothetical protein